MYGYGCFFNVCIEIAMIRKLYIRVCLFIIYFIFAFNVSGVAVLHPMMHVSIFFD